MFFSKHLKTYNIMSFVSVIDIHFYLCYICIIHKTFLQIFICFFVNTTFLLLKNKYIYLNIKTIVCK